MKHGFLYLTEASVCMDLACCLNKHIDFKWSGCYVVLHFVTYKSLAETWRQVALQRLVKPYFIGSRSFVVSNVKSVLHNL